MHAPLRRLFGSLIVLALLASPAAAELVVGVSWSNFQEERWKRDEAAIRATLEAAGARYLPADAQSLAEKQIADVEALLARGARVLIIVAQDADTIRPAVRAAEREGVAVIAYDRLIEMPGVLYLSFDNREVGRIQARSIQALVPEGRYAFLKGAPTDPNTHFVHAGQLDVLQPAIDRGEIEVVGDQFVDNWLPELAQRVMEQMLTSNSNRIDAVVCSNDGMAGGVVAALTAQGLEGTPVSGQDGDHAALNRVARGLQSVSVWKDARALGEAAARAALALASGASPSQVEGAVSWSGGPKGVALPSILLEPIAITPANLDLVIDAHWITRKAVCRGVSGQAPPACQRRP